MRPLFGLTLASLCLLACGESLSPTDANSDYALQGEYSGTNASTGKSVGAQVMALGSGTFRLLLLNGGLPGQGWDSVSPKILSGSIQTTSARFAQNNFDLITNSAGDSLRGTNDLGQTLRMAKVHRQSSTMGMAAPAGAKVLFDGTSLAAWTNGVLDSNHTLSANTSSSGIVSKESFGDFTLHLEFNLPFEAASTGQNRGNSGVYLQGRYELQILDSFGQSLSDLAVTDSIEPRRQCGAFYEQVAPLLNMSYPPLTWQTYDVDFTAARWNTSGVKTQNAKVTVRQNGIFIHQNRILAGSTLAGDAEASFSGPLLLQYHGHSVLFRNIWIVAGGTSSLQKPMKKRRVKTSFYLTPNGRQIPVRSLLTYLPAGGF